jgi:co-chaperonin GroES (HSP10)
MLMPSPSMAFIIQETESVHQSGSLTLVLAKEKKNAGHGTIHSINARVVCPHCIQQFDRKDLQAGDQVLFSKYVAEQIDTDEDGLKGKIVWAVPLDSRLAKINA